MNKVCYIFTGGEVHSLVEAPSDGDLIIAADSGYFTAKSFGITPDLLVGDLDSLDTAVIAPYELDEMEKIIVPAVKDDTDTQLAVDTAISRGYEKIVIVGGLGGRVDHTLSNVFLLEYIADKGIEAILNDGRNRVRILIADNEKRCAKIERGYKYLSLISASDKCCEVSVTGVYYPLNGAEITRSYSYAVSNEIIAESAEVSLFDGRLLIVESGD